MGMPQTSAQYFERIADRWDEVRAGHFTEAVRDAAISKAYLRPEMVVADVGAGTGFVAAGVAPRVSKVLVLDRSAAMLDVARRNLSQFSNVEYHHADGGSLPLPDDLVDVVFANMYLHHCPDPLAAIREVIRILTPGGRLVITDMDAHTNAWFKEEMADEWLGFEREQMRTWFAAAGLVNVSVGGSGQRCSAERQGASVAEEDGRRADCSVFLATGTKRIAMRSAVQEAYTAAIGAGCGCGSQASDSRDMTGQQGSCCGDAPSGQGSSCCGGSDEVADKNAGFAVPYSSGERASVPADAEAVSMGCGNPIALAGLRPGEVVLDIGSGGGMDSFLAAQRVGPQGKVIGVDMTPAMLERATNTARAAGIENVEFRHGQAEALPVSDGTVDVILSNCVINLCEDKGSVFREAYRALKDGGRLEVSDIVTGGPMPLAARLNAGEWAGCISGALPEPEYLDLVEQAGFGDLAVRRSATAGELDGVPVYSVIVSARKGQRPA